MAAFALVAASAAAATSCGGSERVSDPAPSSPARPSVLAHVSTSEPYLARLDAVTLRQRGHAVALGMETPSAWARSPGGGRLAVGSGDGVRFAFIDLRRMRRTASLDLGPRGYVAGLVWPTPRRVVAALSGMEVEIVVIDPVTSRVVRRETLAGTVMRSARTPDGLVLLLSGPGGMGRARLAVVTPSRVRTAELPVRAGVAPPSVFEPALAVGPDGKHALVSPGGAVVHEVGLATLGMAERALTERISLLGRLRSWLEPTASAKGPLDGPVRSASWIPGGGVVVSGWDHRATGERTSVAEAAGVSLVDTRTWSVRTLAEAASVAVVSGDTVLAFGGSYGPGGLRGTGLRAFDRDGRERFHLYGDRYVGAVTAVGRYAYVSEQFETETQIDVVELSTGRVVRTVRTPRYTEILPLD